MVFNAWPTAEECILYFCLFLNFISASLDQCLTCCIHYETMYNNNLKCIKYSVLDSDVCPAKENGNGPST